MFVDLLECMRLVLFAPVDGLKPDDSVVTYGAVFPSNKLLTGAEG